MNYRVEVYFWERSSDGDDWIDSMFSRTFTHIEAAEEYAARERNKKDTISVEIVDLNGEPDPSKIWNDTSVELY